MTSDKRIAVAHDGNYVLAENGPMHMTIQAWKDSRFDLMQAKEAAWFAFSCLEQVASCRKELMHRSFDLLEKLDKKKLPVAFQMVENVLAFDVPDLTPMAAVAGSIADAVADFLFKRGLTRVIVNNGGDIAIRLSGKETARVGIRSDISRPEISQVITLDSRSPTWGVNTSGMGGRSLTRGIASAVTAVAYTSARADAAATALANACFAKDKGIIQVPANQVDPGTDIPGIPVTIQIKNLKPDTILKALSNALSCATAFVQQGLIHGALITAGSRTVHTQGIEEQITC